MKIVIDISEDVYTRLFDNGIETSLEDREAIDMAIRYGTPLPERHGRLIDGDELHYRVCRWIKPPRPDEAHMVDLNDIAVSMLMEIKESHTIIENERCAE